MELPEEGTNKKISEITHQEVSAVYVKMKKTGVIMTGSFQQISKGFLHQFLDINPYKEEFGTIRKSYLASSNADDTEVPDNELQFHDYICQTFFSLTKEPRSVLLELYQKAIVDWKAVESNLDNIQRELDRITRENNPVAIQEQKPLLYHYQELNERAGKEIESFLKDRINDYALSEASDKFFFGLSSFKYPYHYSFHPKAYKVQKPNPLANKFGSLRFDDFREKYESYKKDEPVFWSFVKSYVTEQEILASIGVMCDTNHILAPKSELIREALDTYESGSKTMFANVVPTIIEGIFHGLCMEDKIDERELMGKGFQAKLDLLHPILGQEMYYEYYAFEFRLFRNKVAHGRMTKLDGDRLADMLLLDLYHACKLTSSNKLKVHQKAFLVAELEKSLSNPDYHCLVEYLFLGDVAIPEFYKLVTQVGKVEAIASSAEFMSFLEDQGKNGNEETRHAVFKLTKRILRRRKVHHEQCARIERLTGLKSFDETLVTGYLRNTDRHF